MEPEQDYLGFRNDGPTIRHSLDLSLILHTLKKEYDSGPLGVEDYRPMSLTKTGGIIEYSEHGVDRHIASLNNTMFYIFPSKELLTELAARPVPMDQRVAIIVEGKRSTIRAKMDDYDRVTKRSRFRDPLLHEIATKSTVKFRKFRRIFCPSPGIRECARKCLKNLESEIMKLGGIHPASFGFKRGDSFVSSVEFHTKSSMVLSLDLRDFFDTITGEHVALSLIRIGAEESIARMVAGILTVPRNYKSTKVPEIILSVPLDQRHLPQGSPFSPVLSSLCGYELDIEMSALAIDCGAIYTRYVDDLSFSFRSKTDSKKFFRQAVSKIENLGFHLNYEKVEWMPRYQKGQPKRQVLMGLSVNDKVNILRSTRDWAKAAVRKVEIASWLFAMVGESVRKRTETIKFAMEHMLPGEGARKMIAPLLAEYLEMKEADPLPTYEPIGNTLLNAIVGNNIPSINMLGNTSDAVLMKTINTVFRPDVLGATMIRVGIHATPAQLNLYSASWNSSSLLRIAYQRATGRGPKAEKVFKLCSTLLSSIMSRRGLGDGRAAKLSRIGIEGLPEMTEAEIRGWDDHNGGELFLIYWNLLHYMIHQWVVLGEVRSSIQPETDKSKDFVARALEPTYKSMYGVLNFHSMIDEKSSRRQASFRTGRTMLKRKEVSDLLVGEPVTQLFRSILQSRGLQ